MVRFLLGVFCGFVLGVRPRLSDEGFSDLCLRRLAVNRSNSPKSVNPARDELRVVRDDEESPILSLRLLDFLFGF